METEEENERKSCSGVCFGRRASEEGALSRSRTAVSGFLT